MPGRAGQTCSHHSARIETVQVLQDQRLHLHIFLEDGLTICGEDQCGCVYDFHSASMFVAAVKRLDQLADVADQNNSLAAVSGLADQAGPQLNSLWNRRTSIIALFTAI